MRPAVISIAVIVAAAAVLLGVSSNGLAAPNSPRLVQAPQPAATDVDV